MRKKYGVLLISTFLLMNTQIHANEYYWIQEKGKVALHTKEAGKERIVWAFNYGEKVTKPYFHPITLTDDTVITRFQPKSREHPWHKGLWFSFKYINGVNYWEENKKTWGIGGLTNVVNIDVTTKKDNSATILLTLSYTEQSGKKMVSEKRKLNMSAPDTQGNFHIDWHSIFTAQHDIELGRTPIPEESGGKSHGGYAGYSFRVAENLRSEWLYLTSEQENKTTFTTNKPIHRSQQKWIYAGGKQGGIVLFDHPSNIQSNNKKDKTYWYVGKQHYFSPAFLHQGSQHYTKGESFELMYQATIYNKPNNHKSLTNDYFNYIK